ncbi:hypothetical protein AVEN_65387-1 [Araneus ventricosus]|uniref:Uncharacterized protein n=1 Tax=Araneus ventricosus TaxID=182803 RepID=A0A4Y2NLY8_ARAVE|nr:hypothetical protein AVEN_21678-1 [Araneus ventricosus]GBN39037.1 hypothetical protein AVEN_65387-1 [Araneus ventricosus]
MLLRFKSPKKNNLRLQEKFIQIIGDRSGLSLGAGGLKVRNPIPLKIRRTLGLLHAKSYVGSQKSSRWCSADLTRVLYEAFALVLLLVYLKVPNGVK